MQAMQKYPLLIWASRASGREIDAAAWVEFLGLAAPDRGVATTLHTT
jgi:hypothetical protein